MQNVFITYIQLYMLHCSMLSSLLWYFFEVLKNDLTSTTLHICICMNKLLFVVQTKIDTNTRKLIFILFVRLFLCRYVHGVLQSNQVGTKICTHFSSYDTKATLKPKYYMPKLRNFLVCTTFFITLNVCKEYEKLVSFCCRMMSAFESSWKLKQSRYVSRDHQFDMIN